MCAPGACGTAPSPTRSLSRHPSRMSCRIVMSHTRRWGRRRSAAMPPDECSRENVGEMWQHMTKCYTLWQNMSSSCRDIAACRACEFYDARGGGCAPRAGATPCAPARGIRGRALHRPLGSQESRRVSRLAQIYCNMI